MAKSLCCVKIMLQSWIVNIVNMFLMLFRKEKNYSNFAIAVEEMR